MSTQIVNESTFRRTLNRLQDEDFYGAAWLKALRENALVHFEQVGFPTTADEDWKYTNVAPILKRTSIPEDLIGSDGAEPAAGEALAGQLYAETSGSRLVFLNGSLQKEWSSREALPDDVVVSSIAEALTDEKYSPILRAHLAREADYTQNGFAALNTALSISGAFVLIPSDVKVPVPIGLTFLSTGEGFCAGSFPRTLVVVERGGSATLLESYAGSGSGSYILDAVTEIVLEDNAQLEHLRIQRESEKALHIGTTAVRIGRAAKWNATAINLGANLSRHGITVSLANEGGEAWVDGLYVTGDGQHTDTHSHIDHLVPNCSSHQMYKGILDGKSRAVFNGKVFVHKGAHGTDALQTNRNLLLSNEARVDTKPQLEIFNEDVKCAHGATVGQLEDEELFYLISRGLRPDVAKNLLTYGFAEEVINKIKIESVKKQLDEAVLNRLHASLG
ncbi:MAG: Fe-S cluster assembly protein SufD [Blastocatellia bacterium]|nr:Fe-S cluster assembly protein SufD [Blastocatellia bacterium]